MTLIGLFSIHLQTTVIDRQTDKPTNFKNKPLTFNSRMKETKIAQTLKKKLGHISWANVCIDWQWMDGWMDG